MTARRKHVEPAAPPPAFTGDDYNTMRAMDLTVMSYQDTATAPGDDGRSYWLPRDVAGADLALILWRAATDGNYRFNGWEPQLGPHHHGGRRKTLASALAWVQRARDVRDGKAKNFLGA